MPNVAYQVVDVFTRTRFGGSPFAIIIDARSLSDDTMQHIATELNYSETTFVLPPRDPTNTARVRIFTPANEVPFAFHSNVGTAYVLAGQTEIFERPVTNLMRFEEGAAIIDVRVVWDEGRVVGAAVRALKRLEIGPRIDVGTVAAHASLTPDSVVTSSHDPVTISVDLPFIVAELENLDALAKATPNKAIFAEAEVRYLRPVHPSSFFLYTRLPNQPDRLRARMFASNSPRMQTFPPPSNIPEAPATGGAAAALGAYLSVLRPEMDIINHFEVVQGVEMGRRSVIQLHIEKANGLVRSVLTQGDCVVVMQGTLAL